MDGQLAVIKTPLARSSPPPERGRVSPPSSNNIFHDAPPPPTLLILLYTSLHTCASHPVFLSSLSLFSIRFASRRECSNSVLRFRQSVTVSCSTHIRPGEYSAYEIRSVFIPFEYRGRLRNLS